MTIELTPEQERRINHVVSSGSYGSVDEVMEAALTSVEERMVPGFDGSREELEGLLLDGLASRELSDDEFWLRVDKETNAMLQEGRTGTRR